MRSWARQLTWAHPEPQARHGHVVLAQLLQRFFCCCSLWLRWLCEIAITFSCFTAIKLQFYAACRQTSEASKNNNKDNKSKRQLTEVQPLKRHFKMAAIYGGNSRCQKLRPQNRPWLEHLTVPAMWAIIGCEVWQVNILSKATNESISRSELTIQIGLKRNVSLKNLTGKSRCETLTSSFTIIKSTCSKVSLVRLVLKYFMIVVSNF